MRSLLTVSILFAIIGCQQPFGSDRHDLDGFRILGLHTTPAGGITGDRIEPRAHFVVDGHLWADQSIEQYWFWMDTSDPSVLAAKTKEMANATGAAPELFIPYRNAILGLLAIHPDGTENRSFLAIPATQADNKDHGTILTFQTSQMLSTLSAEDLEIATRSEWDLVQSATFDNDSFGRLEMYFNTAEQQAYRVRWMSTMPFGTFFETTSSATDWAPASVTVDDDEVSVSNSISGGPQTFAALILDENAPRTVQYQDVWVGPSTSGIWIDGRWYPADTAIEYTGLATVEFAKENDTPNGLRIAQWSPLDPQTRSETDPFGTQGLACDVAVTGPFQYDWLTLNWCLRASIIGKPLIVEFHP